jgi:hypothetical protein
MSLSCSINLVPMIYNTAQSIIQLILKLCRISKSAVHPKEAFRKDTKVTEFSIKMEDSFFTRLSRRKRSEFQVL